MVTKKDFKAVAEIIKKNTTVNDNDRVIVKAFGDIRRWVAYDLADYFEQENPRFDRKRFMTACGS